MEHNDLKSCPFCNGEAEYANVGHKGTDDFIEPYVFCKNCGVLTKWYKTKEEARDAWNRRATNET